MDDRHLPQALPHDPPLRTILLERPAAIEDLDPSLALRLDRLLEANRLEASLWDLVRSQGDEGRISPARLTSWRTASLLASARSAAYAEALEEVEEISASRSLPVRLLPSAQVCSRVYPRPELRPLESLDVLAASGRERELHGALKQLRFFELESLLDEPQRTSRQLPALERDGVVVNVFRASMEPDRRHPWDHFAAVEGPGRALEHGPEALLVLFSEEMARRRFAHSLRLLRDVHEVVERLAPSWPILLGQAAESGHSLEAALGLSLASRILGTPIPESILAELAERAGLAPSRSHRLLLVAGAVVLEYPAPPRHVEVLGRLLQKAALTGKTTATQSVA